MMGFKQQIIDARLANPSLRYDQLAELLGCSTNYVKSICGYSRIGYGSSGRRDGLRPSKYRDEILRLRREHPDWGIYKISR
jgi:hypothetical protein